MASAEALQLLVGLDPRAAPGGPLSDLRGTYWLTVPTSSLPDCRMRLPLLGYTEAVDLLAPVAGETEGQPVRWSGVQYRLQRLYQADPKGWRERAPDRRRFLLPGSQGTVREVRGYRGAGGSLERRGLPVEDAAMLVNQVRTTALGLLVDPFAGAGGIALEAARSGWRVLTADVDPLLRLGLARLAEAHVVADAARLPLRPESVDAIVSEPPYPQAIAEVFARSLFEAGRVVRPGGRLAYLVAPWQAELARGLLGGAGLLLLLDEPIDRKGLAVRVLVCAKPVRPMGST